MRRQGKVRRVGGREGGREGGTYPKVGVEESGDRSEDEEAGEDSEGGG